MKFVKAFAYHIEKSTEQPLNMYIEQELKEIREELNTLRKELSELQMGLKISQQNTFISTKEAAQRLGMNRNTLLDHIRKGKIKAIQTCPGNPCSRYKVSEEVINAIMINN